MKIIKTANGKSIRISKSEWESIGRSAGWMRTLRTSALGTDQWIALQEDLQSKSDEKQERYRNEQERIEENNRLRLKRQEKDEKRERLYEVLRDRNLLIEIKKMKNRKRYKEIIPILQERYNLTPSQATRVLTNIDKYLTNYERTGRWWQEKAGW